MRIRSPSLPELHAFVAVVETGSFSRAALRLSVTQGAISRSVLRLEARVGVALLERNAGGVTPTDMGRSYYTQVQPALCALEVAVPEKRKPAGQSLRVSAIYSLNKGWLVPRLPSLYAQHPDLQLVFKPYSRDDSFTRDDVDCWLVARTSLASRWPRHVRATYIVGREIVPICHPSVAERVRAPSDLLAFPMLHHVNYPGNWALWFNAQGIRTSALRLGAGFDLAGGLIEAVAANLGVAVVQRCLIERELSERRVVIPIPLSASTGRGYFLCVPRTQEDQTAVQAFRSWLLEQATA